MISGSELAKSLEARLKLLKEFYGDLSTERVKLETYQHGFPFLEQLLSDGVELEYGEMAFPGLLHKYKLSQLPESRVDELLVSHLQKQSNVCLYFHETANSLFCFNLDNNHKTNATVRIPEMERAVRLLRDQLTELGCEPLIIASGRGYHVWCRLAAPAANRLLYEVMLHAMARTLAGLHERGLDHQKVKANFYPDPRSCRIVSLRLFGSDHIKNKVFSQILSGETLLDETTSWRAFADHLTHKTIPLETLHKAHDILMAAC